MRPANTKCSSLSSCSNLPFRTTSRCRSMSPKSNHDRQLYQDHRQHYHDYHPVPQTLRTTRTCTRCADASSRILNHAQISVHACACLWLCPYFQLSTYLSRDSERRSLWQVQRNKNGCSPADGLEALQKRFHVREGHNSPHNCGQPDNPTKVSFVSTNANNFNLAPLTEPTATKPIPIATDQLAMMDNRGV